MKPTILGFLKKVAASVAPFQKLVLISLAAWVTHILLRVLLLFRSNPYGFPFVSKPDWFIFHAVCIDFMWIVNALVVFLILGGIFYRVTAGKATAKAVVVKATTVLYTAEIELRPTIGGSIGRKFDPETGTGFWDFKD